VVDKVRRGTRVGVEKVGRRIWVRGKINAGESRGRECLGEGNRI
jgi:hypothetical protein